MNNCKSYSEYGYAFHHTTVADPKPESYLCESGLCFKIASIA